jgi:hypothetical protein
MATNFTLFGMGACNCPSGTCSCTPCALPQVNLSVSWNIPSGGGCTTTGTGTLTYQGGTSCQWIICFNTGLGGGCVQSGQLTITCASGTGMYVYTTYSVINCVGLVSTFTLTATAVSCSPLNIDLLFGGVVHWFTITP